MPHARVSGPFVCSIFFQRDVHCQPRNTANDSRKNMSENMVQRITLRTLRTHMRAHVTLRRRNANLGVLLLVSTVLLQFPRQSDRSKDGEKLVS